MPSLLRNVIETMKRHPGSHSFGGEPMFFFGGVLAWKFTHPKDHWTLQWKGLNLHSRGWILKIASFEGSGSLGQKRLRNVVFL